jgi:hypothetical protein
MPASAIPERKRGPQKGDGGRPRITLRNDFPDNQIVATALWLSAGKRALGTPFLEMLIYLFDDGDFVKTPDDGIGAVTMRCGVPMVMISALKNARPARAPGANYPGGSRRQTPDGRTLMKDRVRVVRDKIKKYSPPRKQTDQLWLSISFAGLDYLLAGQKKQAMVAFGHAGWPIFGPEMERLGQFLNMNGFAHL